MTTKETAYQTIAALVERFDEQKASYKKSDYNETLVRRDFIDAFFKALGWDVDNARGYAENYFLFEKYLPKLRGGFYEPSYVFFKNFPIKKIDFDNRGKTPPR